jgi:transposase
VEQITTVGIDLAKNVFSLHGVDAGGKTVLRRTVRRDRLVETVAALSPCLIGMEACSGAHEWGRRVRAARAHGEADGAEVCSALQEERQERRQ